MRNPIARNAFYDEVGKFIEAAPIEAAFMVVRKQLHANKYVRPADPYELSFENILNRILHYSKSNEIEIYPECRQPLLDKALLAEYTKYSIRGTTFHTANEITTRVKTFAHKDKKENNSGMQIADLLTNPVGRHFLGMKPKPPGNEVPYSLVRKKFAGQMALTVFP